MTAMPMAAPVAAPKAFALRPYFAYVRIGATLEWEAKAALVGRAAFLVVILFVFSRIWQLVLRSGQLQGRSEAELLWYLAVTELVLLSFPMVHKDMEADFKAGDMLVRLSQPVSYAGARFAEGLGGTAVRLAAFAPIAILAPAVLSGRFPPPASLPVALVLVLPAVTLALLSVSTIGLAAAWLHDCSPVYWAWQKFAFVFGGLLLPLEIYPDWLRTIALWTPFAAMVNGPGRAVFSASPDDTLATVVRLAVWLGVAAGLYAWLWRRTLRVLDGLGS